MDDTAVVRRCLDGDHDAFGELVRRYEHAIYGLALSHIRDFEIAEDLAQEAFIAAYQHLPRLHDPAKFGAWLKTTAVNLCRNRRRSRQTEQASLERAKEDIRLNGEGPLLPDRRYETAEARRHTLAAINRLSEIHAQALVLYYVSGMNTAEIASTLGVKPATIEQRLHRARKQLKEEMTAMVNQVLTTSHPEEFPEKVLREIAKRAQEARDLHNNIQAVQHYNTALDILDDLDETEEQKRWTADMLWERGRASQFLKQDNNRDVVAQLEASLKIEENIGDRKKYAERLAGLAMVYSSTRPSDALKLCQQAAAIFEAIGETTWHALCLYSTGKLYLPWWPTDRSDIETDYGKSLACFHQAEALFHQAEESSTEAMSRAAIKLLEKAGESPDSSFTQSIGAGCFPIERTPTTLTWKERHLSGFYYTNAMPNESPVASVFQYVSQPSVLIPLPIRIGVSHTYPAFACGTAKMQATSRANRLDADIETAAGLFQQCLELETVFDIKEQDLDTHHQERNRWISGTRTMWFAPGVGPAKVIYRHGDGAETTVQLTDYTMPETTEDFFPLQTGAGWKYRVTNTRSSYAVLDTWWVAGQDGDRSIISQYNYSEKA